MRDYRLFLKDIINAMEAIESFVEGMNFEDFVEDDRTSSGDKKVWDNWRSLKYIPEWVKEKYPDIPWKDGWNEG